MTVDTAFNKAQKNVALRETTDPIAVGALLDELKRLRDAIQLEGTENLAIRSDISRDDLELFIVKQGYRLTALLLIKNNLMINTYTKEQIDIALGVLSGRINPETGFMWFEDAQKLHGFCLRGRLEGGQGNPGVEAHRRKVEEILLALITHGVEKSTVSDVQKVHGIPLKRATQLVETWAGRTAQCLRDADYHKKRSPMKDTDKDIKAAIYEARASIYRVCIQHLELEIALAKKVRIKAHENT
jgi:hypothetical protein